MYSILKWNVNGVTTKTYRTYSKQNITLFIQKNISHSNNLPMGKETLIEIESLFRKLLQSFLGSSVCIF